MFSTVVETRQYLVSYLLSITARSLLKVGYIYTLYESVLNTSQCRTEYLRLCIFSDLSYILMVRKNLVLNLGSIIISSTNFIHEPPNKAIGITPTTATFINHKCQLSECQSLKWFIHYLSEFSLFIECMLHLLSELVLICTDKISNCASYGTVVCYDVEYGKWALEACCGYCKYV